MLKGHKKISNETQECGRKFREVFPKSTETCSRDRTERRLERDTRRHNATGEFPRILTHGLLMARRHQRGLPQYCGDRNWRRRFHALFPRSLSGARMSGGVRAAGNLKHLAGYLVSSRCSFPLPSLPKIVPSSTAQRPDVGLLRVWNRKARPNILKCIEAKNPNRTCAGKGCPH